MLVGVSQTESNPGQGFSVALGGGGNTALVGGPTDNANTGAAWVFVRGGGTWNQRGRKLVGPDAVGAASQATSVALSSNDFTAIVGGTLDQDEIGAAWIFTNTAPASAVGISPPLSTHDFNGDGNSDVLWQDAASDVGMWLMNGSAILQTAVPGKVPTNWSVVGQRDFNGDGFADILWRDTAGDVGIWLMNGTQIISSTVIGNVPINWSVAATGDFNWRWLWRHSLARHERQCRHMADEWHNYLTDGRYWQCARQLDDCRRRHVRRHLLAQYHDWRSRNVGDHGRFDHAVGRFRGRAADVDDRRHWRFRRQRIDRYSLARYERECRRLAAERH